MVGEVMIQAPSKILRHLTLNNFAIKSPVIEVLNDSPLRAGIMVGENIATHHDSDSEQDFTSHNCKFVLNEITCGIGSQYFPT